MAEVTTKQDRIVGLLTNHLGVEPNKVTADARFIEDLGADSLDIVEIIMALEEEFNCEITDEESENCATVGAVFELIEGKHTS